MTNIPDFRGSIPLAERKQEYAKLKERHPERIPIILTAHATSKLPKLKKNKFLVPKSLTIGQFMCSVRRRMSLPPDIGLFFFINDEIMSASSDLSFAYEQHKNEDGFLYMSLTGENTFG